jgi:hypothetical protein
MNPEDGLMHWYMTLLSHPEYKVLDERIGTAAQRPIDDDGNLLSPPPIERIKHFRTAINTGIFPHPDTLAWVASCFGKYIESARQGEAVSFEQAFDLKPKQRVGKPAQQDAAQEARNQRCWEMQRHLDNNPDATQLEAAEAVEAMENLPEIDTPDCETMVRDYAEWKKVFDPKIDGE